MIPRLEFDPEEHRFTAEGRPVPSVTGVLKDLGFIDTRWYNDEARDRGTYVHAACTFIDEERLNWKKVPEQYQGYLKAYIAWKDYTKFRIQSNEVLVSNREFWYAGWVDKVGILWRHKTIIDLKTGGEADWHKLQSAAYGLCFPRKPQRYTLYLKEDGKYSMKASHDDEVDYWDWRCIMRTYWRKNG